MSLWAEYIAERLGAGCLEEDNGFVTYKIDGPICAIHDLYIRPDFRPRGLAKHLVHKLAEVAIAQGCQAITATFWLNDIQATKTLKWALGCGFELLKAEAGVITVARRLTTPIVQDIDFVALESRPPTGPTANSK